MDRMGNLLAPNLKTATHVRFCGRSGQKARTDGFIQLPQNISAILVPSFGFRKLG